MADDRVPSFVQFHQFGAVMMFKSIVERVPCSRHPMLFVDTAGVDDVGALCTQRIEKTRLSIARSDIGVLVTEAGVWGEFEDQLLARLRSHAIPVLVALNKSDLRHDTAEQVAHFVRE